MVKQLGRVVLPITIIYVGARDAASNVFQTYLQHLGYRAEVVTDPSALCKVVSSYPAAGTVLAETATTDEQVEEARQLWECIHGPNYHTFLIADEPFAPPVPDAEVIGRPNALRQIVGRIEALRWRARPGSAAT